MNAGLLVTPSGGTKLSVPLLPTVQFTAAKLFLNTFATYRDPDDYNNKHLRFQGK
jgi:hypothetical protein